jgi:hypothetical protein
LKNHFFVTWFVNASSHFYLNGIDKNAVTKARINEFRDVQQKACTVDDFMEKGLEALFPARGRAVL